MVVFLRDNRRVNSFDYVAAVRTKCFYELISLLGALFRTCSNEDKHCCFNEDAA